MELIKNLENNVTNNIDIERKQNNFLDSTLGKAVNTGLDLGLRMLLPDLIENQIIDIKNTLLREGLGAGIKKAISSAVDLGKSALGIVTGNFENISQVQIAVQKGGLIDGVSDVIDFVLDRTEMKGKLPYFVTNTIRNGKDTLLTTISNNIENELNKQLQSLEKLERYSKNWKEYFNNKNFEGMTKEIYKINAEIKQLMPMENTLKETKTIQNLHKLIKNNGKEFNLTEEQRKLAEILN